MFPRIEPTIEALTTSCRPLPSANRAMISSGALPKVTLSRPPIPARPLGELLGGPPHQRGGRDHAERRDERRRRSPGPRPDRRSPRPGSQQREQVGPAVGPEKATPGLVKGRRRASLTRYVRSAAELSRSAHLSASARRARCLRETLLVRLDAGGAGCGGRPPDSGSAPPVPRPPAQRVTEPAGLTPSNWKRLLRGCGFAGAAEGLRLVDVGEVELNVDGERVRCTRRTRPAASDRRRSGTGEAACRSRPSTRRCRPTGRRR